MVLCDPSGNLRRATLGADLRSGEVVQQVVPAGTWQGLRLRAGGAFGLVGTTMTPGFREDAFRLASPADIAGFPGAVRAVLRPYLAAHGPERE